jgi:nucleotide-binding universal stress UspA family protein
MMPGEQGDISYRLIVAAVDGSPAAQHAAMHAMMLSRLTGARLQIIYVVDTHVTFQMGMYQELALETLQQDGEKVVAETVKSAREAGVDATGEVMSGSPRAVIVEWAKQNGADLIVVGSHGYSRLTYLLIGSVADYVVHNAHCPVMVVRR